MCSLLIVVASLDAERRLRACRASIVTAPSSVVVARWLCCPEARGIVPDQRSNPCALHWQADSQPLDHQGSSFSSILPYIPVLAKHINQWLPEKGHMGGKVLEVCIYIRPNKAAMYEVAFQVVLVKNLPAKCRRCLKRLSMHAHYVYNFVLLSPS